MLYQIQDGTVSVGGNQILSHIDFEIRGKEKIAVVGRNGAGKTTLLKLIAGELELDRDDRRQGNGIVISRKLTIGMLKQKMDVGSGYTAEEELLRSCPTDDWTSRERFEYEKEYDRLFTGFGFEKEDKKKKLSEFSGGEQTKLALIRLLLEKPDILLLDEPTNHLDMETVEWLEEYLKSYGKAVVMVSHDRFFLDRTAEVIYELRNGRLFRFPGNYTHFRMEKQKAMVLQRKAYEKQQEEIKRLEGLIERFKHKPKKAAFARSRKKLLERMERVDQPETETIPKFAGKLVPLNVGPKWVLETERLKIGYEKALLELTFKIRKGQKIGIIGSNGAGKTTFLKTAAGLLPPISGKLRLGNGVVIGYFDQLSAEVESDQSVADHFHDLFPSMTEKEVRGILGSYLFGGREAAKRVSDLSGGEKARLLLAELLQTRPNFMILDEPTNHMDIQAKEILEAAFQAYEGTLLFVSHDRYFIDQVADAVLIFEEQAAMYYPFGYEHYLEKSRQIGNMELSARIRAEEQALISGLKAVPKAERRFQREIPEEEAYQEWRMRLAKEKVDKGQAIVENLWLERENLWITWINSEYFWKGDSWQQEEEYQMLTRDLESAWDHWNNACLEWLDGCES